jgi:hypothetical protein
MSQLQAHHKALMGTQASILPMILCIYARDTTRHYAAIIEKHGDVGQGQERDSFHYIEHMYFLWEYNNCSIKLFWSDEEATPEWLWLTIEYENTNANDIADRLLEKLRPYLQESRVKFSR